MEKKIFYFGYGANAYPEMIEALLGRKAKGKKAILKDYGLFLQSFSEVPSKAQSLLQKCGWGKTFLSYIITPCKGSVVHGTLWEMTSQERAIIGEWELHHFWYIPIKVRIDTKNKKGILVQTEIIPQYSTDKKPIIKEKYSSFPNAKTKMLHLARKVRKEFLEKRVH
ncbi:MAG: gamma-glutamylcyclotransferase family protein [bacterium]|nr:gamma-glutamylcyclotransferase family protein [bacterium]